MFVTLWLAFAFRETQDDGIIKVCSNTFMSIASVRNPSADRWSCLHCKSDRRQWQTNMCRSRRGPRTFSYGAVHSRESIYGSIEEAEALKAPEACYRLNQLLRTGPNLFGKDATLLRPCIEELYNAVLSRDEPCVVLCCSFGCDVW